MRPQFHRFTFHVSRFNASSNPATFPRVAASYDIIIAGLGAMGSAAAFHLARRGTRVLGLDRFAPPHCLGSSHGQTRIIREAYFEHPTYVPIVQRAYHLWEELAKAAGAELFRQTGGLMIGAPDSTLVRGAKLSADTHGLAYEMLSAAELRRRFPALRPADDMLAVLEPRAGVLFPNRCIAAHLELARRHGAELRFDEPVERWEPDGQGVRVATSHGEFTAAQLIVSVGAWVNTLLPGLPMRVERQVQLWFEPEQSSAPFAPERCPIHMWQFDGRRFFYGIPDFGEGLKVAFHHDGESTTPDAVRREVAPGEVEAMRTVLRRFVPGADGPPCAATVCLYTNTPDEHFWIDRHRDCPQVLVASPCSGHGFKFSAAIGEILADLAQGQPPKFDLSLFQAR
jgi:sarcosine oxidase